MAKITNQFCEDDVRQLVSIGFCQPKFYKPAVWQKAKRFMETIVCKNNLAREYNFGRGKGKFTSDLCIEVVKERVVAILQESGQLKQRPQ